MPSNHDARYKRFFSNPILLRELLESFVPEDFIRELDFSTLKRVDKSFVTEEFRERESDLIHQVRYRDSTVYIFARQGRRATAPPVRFNGRVRHG